MNIAVYCASRPGNAYDTDLDSLCLYLYSLLEEAAANP